MDSSGDSVGAVIGTLVGGIGCRSDLLNGAEEIRSSRVR